MQVTFTHCFLFLYLFFIFFFNCTQCLCLCLSLSRGQYILMNTIGNVPELHKKASFHLQSLFRCEVGLPKRAANQETHFKIKKKKRQSGCKAWTKDGSRLKLSTRHGLSKWRRVEAETKLHNSKQTEANADLPCKLDNN